jgi:hypothetical protein
MTKELTPAQVTALHELAGKFPWRANGGSCKVLVARGYATKDRGYYSTRRSYTITPEGQAAHDAIFTPEKIAADAAAEQAERDDRIRAAQQRRAELQGIADRRNEAITELIHLLGDGVDTLPYGLLSEAKVERDASGVHGGDTYQRMTNVQILAIVKAALAEAQR